MTLTLPKGKEKSLKRKYYHDCKERCDLDITKREIKMFEEEMLSRL